MLTYFSAMISDAKSIDMYVNSECGLVFRIEPDQEADIIEVLSFGTKVNVKKRNLGSDKCWAKIKVNDNKGYVHMDYLQTENPLEGMTYLGNWHITAYTHTGSPCANGNYPTSGYTVACNSLDFGTEIYIKGIGFRTVEDRGPGWLGSEWIDCFLDSHTSCVVFGSQYLDVYLVNND